MRIYLDCEFNGFGGELISMGMASESGHLFYSVLPEPRTWDKWCYENVFPVLGMEPVDSYEDFRLAFFEYLRNFDNPTIVADWPADLVYFFQVMLGKNHAQSILRPCTAELVSVDYVSKVPHNALQDAQAIRMELQKGLAHP